MIAEIGTIEQAKNAPAANWLGDQISDADRAMAFAKKTTADALTFVDGMSTGEKFAVAGAVAGVAVGALALHSRAGFNFAKAVAEEIPGVKKIPACWPVETMAIVEGKMPHHLAWSSRQQPWYKALLTPKNRPIPEFTEAGFLPPGEHPATWSQISERFGSTPERQVVLNNMHTAVHDLTEAGARKIYVGGSFVTRKPNPSDFDIGWLSNGVADSAKARPEFNVFGSKQKYGGDIFQNVAFEAQYANAVPGGRAMPAQDYLRYNRRVGKDVGVIVLDIARSPELKALRTLAH